MQPLAYIKPSVWIVLWLKIAIFCTMKAMKQWKDWQWYLVYALVFIPFSLLVLSTFD